MTRLAELDPGSFLRVLLRGGAGTGKSTLAGRLLRDGAARPELGVLALEVDGSVHASSDFFSTRLRRYVVADTAAGEDGARQLVAPATSAELALLVVDASAGVDAAARREGYFLSLLGAERLVFAVNKMDSIAGAEQAFAAIAAELGAFSSALGVQGVAVVPISATRGDNVVARSSAMPWYHGPTLLDACESVDVAPGARRPLRFRVERVNADRSATGTVVAGRLRRGDLVRLQPSARTSRVTRLTAAAGDVESASAGASVTVAFEDPSELHSSDVVVASDAPVEVAAQFEATIAWASESPLFPGRSYVLDFAPARVSATIAPLKYKLDLNRVERAAATKLELGEIGVCNLQLERPIPFEPYRENRALGGFLLVDALSDATLGAGMLHFALRRAQNVHWQAIDVNKAARAAQKGQKPCVLWFTGLSGAGKSAIANLVDKRLHALRRHGYLLDGDNVRHGLNKDLGFTAADRVENIRRIAEVAKLMVDAGLIVSTAFISPFRAERRMARALLAPGEFIEVFVDTPLAVAEARDPKGLYKKARRGELKNFTGIDSPYEVPERAELHIDTTRTSPAEAAERVIAYLTERGFLGGD